MSTRVFSREGIRWEANAFLGFFERQVNLYKRYWAWEAVWFVYNVVSTMSIGYLASGLNTLGVSSDAATVHKAQLYLLVGSLLWSYLSLVFFEVSFAIAWERWEGTIEYTFMAPVKRVTHLMGVCCFAIVYGVARTALILGVVAVTFQLDLSKADLGSAAVILAVATLPLLGMGIFSAILPLLSPEKGEQMTFAVQGVLLLVSGVYYPTTVLPMVLQGIGAASPLTYTLRGIRAALLERQSITASLPTIGILALMGVVLIGSGLWAFARAERRAKRLGLLKRSG